jgi:tRNA(adenine34) deaminase
MEDKYMLEAIKEAKKAFKSGDVPVGAVIVENNKIIARSHNKKELLNIATSHAEINVINIACKKKNSWRLDSCELYVTSEPCLMCAGAIIQSRIKRLIYGPSNEKFGYVKSIDQVLNNKKNNHIVDIKNGVCEKEITNMLKEFFKDKRN